MQIRLRRSVAWLAAFAMALQALWPLLAQAKPRSVTLVPICTVDGVTHYYELKGGETPLEQRSASHGEHCAFCTLDVGAVVPAALRSFSDVSVPAIDIAPKQSPFPSSNGFSSARPRAPPSFS